MKIQLEAKGQNEEMVLAYLEENASEVLAEKINNGVRIEKDGKTLINKKNLTGFMSYALEEARKMAEKGARGTFVKNEVVYGWAIHYFEEDSIEGTLYNEDGTKYEKPKPAPQKKAEKSKKKEPTKLIPVVARDENEKKQGTEQQSKPKEQLSLFDFNFGESKAEEKQIEQVVQASETQQEDQYEVYAGEIPEEMDVQPIQAQTDTETVGASQNDEYEIVEEETFEYEVEDSFSVEPAIEEKDMQVEEMAEKIEAAEEEEKHWISDTMYVDGNGEVHTVEEDIIAKEKEFAKAFEIGALAVLDEMFGTMLAMG